MDDYPAALQRSVALDNTIRTAALAVSPEYADLVSLAARHVVASTEITVVTRKDGSFDLSDVKTFMRDVGTSG